MTKAFGYLRVSGKGQVQGDGFPRQLAAIKGYADLKGIKVVRAFEEQGISGAKDPTENLASRPAWIEMLAIITTNGVRTIIVERLERLARDLMVQEHVLADLRRRGITLVSVAEPDLCSDDPTRTLLRQIMGAIAEYDRKMVVIKLRGARIRTKAKTGSCEGRKPFGYYEGEQQALARMKALRAAGLGFDKIAEKLNAESVPQRTGKRWWGRTINNILTAQG